jgi:hypothetical protein
LVDQIETLPTPPLVVIVDTFSRNMSGAENEAQEISTFYRNAEHRLVNSFGCAVIAAHHPGKDAKRGMRGSASLKQNADSVFLAQARQLADGIQYTVLCAEKMKDARFPPDASFRAVEYTIPDLVDKFDVGVTTLAVEYDSTVINKATRDKVSSTESQDMRLLSAIHDKPRQTQQFYADLTSINKSSVQRGITRLKKSGWINCTKSGSPSITREGGDLLKSQANQLINMLNQLEPR